MLRNCPYKTRLLKDNSAYFICEKTGVSCESKECEDNDMIFTRANLFGNVIEGVPYQNRMTKQKCLVVDTDLVNHTSNEHLVFYTFNGMIHIDSEDHFNSHFEKLV
jgi:hypothetical protein